MIIETQRATLDTLSVTIQALHVSGKQMTLAVFRQLPVASAYTKTGALDDLEFWGFVRYPIKNQGDEWIVAAKNGSLYRCNFSAPFLEIDEARRRENHALKELDWWLEYKACRENNRRVPERPTLHQFVRRKDWAPDELPNLEKNLAACQREWMNSVRADQSMLELAKTLPQLFIAV
jgi:hypothetical protein